MILECVLPERFELLGIRDELLKIRRGGWHVPKDVA
jgi:hypothetical protein